MDDENFRQLLNFFELSWSGYRKVRKGVKKRVSRHMQSQGCRRMADYIQMLRDSHDAREQCERLMCVSISRFFRDWQLWLFLEQSMLPDLLQREQSSIRIWSAGCASGEEVYSFKIIWERLRSRIDRLPDAQMLATDRIPEHLARAQTGVYTAGSVKKVPEELLQVFFHKLPGRKGYRVRQILKTGIVWQVHHLLTAPPGSNFILIFLRNNLLTYYQDELKITAFKNILSCLAPGGFLVIGAHEILPVDSPDLQPVVPFSFVFQKQLPF